MTKEHKLYKLTKQLVYQMTGEYTEDVQNSDFQIAWHYAFIGLVIIGIIAVVRGLAILWLWLNFRGR